MMRFCGAQVTKTMGGARLTSNTSETSIFFAQNSPTGHLQFTHNSLMLYAYVANIFRVRCISTAIFGPQYLFSLSPDRPRW